MAGSQTVEELFMNNEELPENYIHKDSKGFMDASPSSMEIPVIDLGLLISSSPTVEELEKFRAALSSWGCFQAINHGMTDSFLDEVQEVSKQFFALPMEEKKKYSRTENAIEGYGSDMVLSEDQILDWTDRLYLLVNPQDQRKLEFWPKNPENFREILAEYTIKLKQMNEALLRAMARSLNLKDDCFVNQCGGEQTVMFTRFNLYPPCPRPDCVLGLKPHADGSAMTILLPDREVEGLQFWKDVQWVRVPIIPHAFLINVGDQMEIMSNGLIKSPVHRVITNSERERMSLAMFCAPGSDKEIGPVEGLITEARPRLYKTVKNYVDSYFQYFQKGLRPIDAVKI
ncbi:protein SRG1-like [Malania oleifera]|uniref:protein SRG1-like n=1 Tax=Malania oleifera TaxID=397392 RepID=UPI0025AD9FBD|nr:protein SRG1-like [Malania oleifera]